MGEKVTANGFGELKEDYLSPFDTGELQIKKTIYTKYVKRCFDIVLSSIAIVVTLPINIVIGVVTLCSLGRPVFFSHKRPGLAEKPFTIVKFRNMTNDTDESGELLPPDQRTTKLGSFLRKTSLDELL